jgi:hypothetical protein
MRRYLHALPILALVTSLSAQSRTGLTRPEAEYPEPFTGIRGIRELPDGRVIVSDIQDKVVQIVDFRAGTAARIGREGQGPEEYAIPAGLFATPDGGALLQDFGNRRFLAIGPDGRIGRIVSPPESRARTDVPGRGAPPMLFGALLDTRGADRQGRLYFQGMTLPSPDGSWVDSVPIMRWDRATAIDTLGWVRLSADMRPQVIRSGNTTNMHIGSGKAWPAEVAWGVSGDGRIALVEAEPYRVTWLGPNRTVGPTVSFSPIVVTDADKKEYREQMSRARPVVMMYGGPSGARAAPPPAIRPATEEPEWPRTKPPFSGRDAVMVTPEGQVWVERTRKAGDSTPVYDLFDGTGRLSGQVALRPRSRVAGFGKGTVYVVRTDADDLQYLERYKRQ